MTAPNEFATIPEIIEAARARLEPRLWDACCGGAESEITLRRNRTALDRLAFRPRVLRDVAGQDTSATFLGHRLALPVMLAPVGFVRQLHPQSGLACARTAQRAGTCAFLTSGATSAPPGLAELRKAIDGPVFSQLYVRGDRDWLRVTVGQIESAGYDGLAITIDCPGDGRRERDLHHRYFPRVWPDPAQVYQASFTWEEFAWLRGVTRLPLILKGIQHPEDAALAVVHGADVVYVSNHGGRMLDQVPATIDELGQIVQRVGGRAEVVVDGGFLRGSDVLKALALGARAVLIGRLQAWSLAAGGEEGLARALDLLREEMLLNMANLGVRSLAELSPDLVVPAAPPDPAPWPVGLVPLPRAD